MNPLETQIRKLFMDIVNDAQNGFNSANGKQWKIDVNNIKYSLKQIEEKLNQLKCPLIVLLVLLRYQFESHLQVHRLYHERSLTIIGRSFHR